MILSIFLHDNQFHIASEYDAEIYNVTDKRKMADNIMLFIDGFLKNANISDVDKIVFPNGPASFTSIRIINSLVKGLCIAKPDIKHIGVSNFLTYIYVKNKPSGTVSIPTQRGDFFVADYFDWQIKKTYLSDQNCTISIEKNLAKAQIDLLDSDMVAKNSNFITQDFVLDYGFTPVFKN